MQATKTFRVDRMKDVMVDESSYREGDRFFEEMNIVEYANTAFSMYGGETINILLRVKMELAGVIADRFGRNITLYHDEDDQYFRCSVEVQKSQQFYSWLSGFGKDIELIYPNSLRDDYLQYLNDILQYYGSHNDLNHSTWKYLLRQDKSSEHLFGAFINGTVLYKAMKNSLSVTAEKSSFVRLKKTLTNGEKLYILKVYRLWKEEVIRVTVQREDMDGVNIRQYRMKYILELSGWKGQ